MKSEVGYRNLGTSNVLLAILPVKNQEFPIPMYWRMYQSMDINVVLLEDW